MAKKKADPTRPYVVNLALLPDGGAQLKEHLKALDVRWLVHEGHAHVHLLPDQIPQAVEIAGKDTSGIDNLISMDVYVLQQADALRSSTPAAIAGPTADSVPAPAPAVPQPSSSSFGGVPTSTPNAPTLGGWDSTQRMTARQRRLAAQRTPAGAPASIHQGQRAEQHAGRVQVDPVQAVRDGIAACQRLSAPIADGHARTLSGKLPIPASAGVFRWSRETDGWYLVHHPRLDNNVKASGTTHGPFTAWADLIAVATGMAGATVAPTAQASAQLAYSDG